MYLLDFTVRSSCGLSAVATRTDASLFILDVFRMEPSVNSVAALTLSRDLGEIRKALSSDFTKFRIEADRKATLITGRKKGHGVMDAIILGGGTLVFPVIATGGTERFRVIVSSRGDAEGIMSSVERLNDIEAYTYQRCSAHEALELMTLRGFTPYALGLTETEWRIMKSAYLHGFYSWPRELDADSIGSMFNISKVTALYHLRRAEGKIVRAIVERFT